jgi:DNA-directed RNA polymerase subunit M/transcription elongation factor TFIIS
MKFCPTCNNLLSPYEDEDKLMNKCLTCGYTEENDQLIIKKTNYKEIVVESTEINVNLKHDSTLQRTIHKVCPNEVCISHKDKSINDFVMIQDAKNIKMTYICANCHTEWKYSS